MIKYSQSLQNVITIDLEHFYSYWKVDQNDVLHLFDDFTTMASETKYNTIKETKEKRIKTTINTSQITNGYYECKSR